MNHSRKSIRLKGYDYSRKGSYFVTICCQNRAHLFGEVIKGEMILNDAGKMIEKWYFELENKFKDIKCHEMIVMPNHFHCIINNVGADLCVCPNNDQPVCPNNNQSISSGENLKMSGEHIGSPQHLGSPQQIGSFLYQVVQWFKTMTTNEYIRNVKSNNWKRFDGKLWQRNYWEHIIRNEKSYLNISEYIKSNPSKWEIDSFNPS